MNFLYGDGIHDDYPAIQELLNSGACEVCLPAPKKEYLISKTLKIYGGQTLKIPRFAVIKLLPQSNCCMIEDSDFSIWKEDICIDGGIWDMNNAEQDPNPYHFVGNDGKKAFERFGIKSHEECYLYHKKITKFVEWYTGFCMRFCRIKRFILKNVTIKNPVTYGVQIGYIEDFSISNLMFNYQQGAPKLWNMDGVHVEGHCKNGVISNLQGTCHDDTVAITADDGLYGPIENILIDGIFAEHAHSAVRLLSHGLPVKNVTIRNIFGSFYTYCVGMTKYHGGEDERGIMENITIENVNASASVGTIDVGGGNYPFIWAEKGLDIKNLRIQNINRNEKTYPTSLLQIDKGTSIDGLTVRDIYLTNELKKPIKILDFKGDIKNFKEENIVKGCQNENWRYN